MMRSAGLCATLATVAQAFLVPSTMSLGGNDDKPDIALLRGVDPFTRLLKLPCKDCLYAQPSDDGFAWTQGVENALFANISVSENYQAILLNGYQIYPPVLPFDVFYPKSRASDDINGETPLVPSIAQIPASAAVSDITAHPDQFITKPLRVTDWVLSSGVVKTVEAGNQIISVNLDMRALEGHQLKIPNLKLTALKQPTGKLTILDAEILESHGGNGVDGSFGSEICESMPFFCEMRDKLSGTLSGLRGKMQGMRKGCHGKHHGVGNGMRPHEMRPHRPGNPRPGKFDLPKMHAGEHHREHHGHVEHEWDGNRHGHDHHHHHHGMHGFFHRAAHVIWSVLVPIAIGFAIGVAVYFVGFLAGAVIAVVCARLMGSRRGYEVVLVEDEDEDAKEDLEKAEYYAEEEDEALPLYVEVVETKEDTKQ